MELGTLEQIIFVMTWKMHLYYSWHLVQCFFLIFVYFYVKTESHTYKHTQRMRKQERDGERGENHWSTGLLSKYLQKPRAVLCQTQEFHLISVSMWMSETRVLRHHGLPPRYVRRKLDKKQTRLKPNIPYRIHNIQAICLFYCVATFTQIHSFYLRKTMDCHHFLHHINVIPWGL